MMCDHDTLTGQPATEQKTLLADFPSTSVSSAHSRLVPNTGSTNGSMPNHQSDHQIEYESLDDMTNISNMSENWPQESRDQLIPTDKNIYAPTEWFPFTIRWPFLCFHFVFSGILFILLVVLFWYSSTHYGLGTDNSSAILLFGWRFTPTLVAVIYVQLSTMLLNDVKRTEPFARLAQRGGSDAKSTILRAGVSWLALIKCLNKDKTDGRRNWLLFWTMLLNVISFLAISPLSSSLLVSGKIAVPSTVDFSHLVPRIDVPLHLSAERITYFRSIGNILQNISTSAWITEKYAVLPFWPSDMNNAPLGPLLSASSESWQAETLVLSTELNCDPMSLVRSAFQQRPEKGIDEELLASAIYTNYSIVLESSAGCTFGYDASLATYVTNSAFSFWSNISTLPLPTWQVNGDGEGLYVEKGINSTSECRNGEFLLISERWTLDSQNSTNQTFNPGISSAICFPTYYMANMSVIASTSDGSTELSFNESEYSEKRVPIPVAFLDTNEFRNWSLAANWTDYLYPPKGDLSPRASTGGLSALLAALYDYNLTAMVTDTDIISQAARIKQRIFGEVLQSSLTQPDASQTLTIRGTITTDETRIYVVNGPAIALMVLLFMSSVLLVLISKLSNRTCRPLNLIGDPATTGALASLITKEHQTRRMLLGLHQCSHEEIKRRLEKTIFYTSIDTIYGSQYAVHNDKASKTAQNIASTQSDWRPLVLRLRTLAVFILFLICLLAAIVVLNNFAQTSQLYQTFFVYSSTVNAFGSQFSLAPFSIITTMVAVIVSLWWGAIDENLRRLQPYLSMSKRPTPISRGVSLSYQSSYWMWAVWKSALNGHWLLCLVTLGTILCQILTVSMSAIFERQLGNLVDSVQVQTSLALRQIPHLDTAPPSVDATSGAGDILTNVFTNLSTNWMYSAVLQLSLDGSEPAWSQNGWSFVPSDVSQIQDAKSIQILGGSKSIEDDSIRPGVNISLTTPAIRGRIECSQHSGLNNISNWLTPAELSNSALWNVSANPKGFTSGYQLGVNAESVGNSTQGFMLLPDPSAGSLTNSLFNTTVYANPSILTCCSNGTSSLPQSVAVGFWSWNNPARALFSSYPGPINFTVKWIYGQAALFQVNKTGNLSLEWGDTVLHRLVFTDVPEVQAINCQPVVETARADVTVDQSSGRVQEFTILGDQISDQGAWSDAFLFHNLSKSDPRYDIGLIKASQNVTDNLSLNVTSSYGTIFLASLLGASDLENIAGLGTQNFGFGETEGDNTFNFRDSKKGLNTDFMTYAMYTMVNSNPRALLDSTTLKNTAETTYQTFFQHYVSSDVSMESGGWAFQTINASLPPDLGQAVLLQVQAGGKKVGNTVYNFANITRVDASNQQDILYSNVSTNRTAFASTSTQIEMLMTQQTAVWLSVGIVVWLVVTLVVLSVLQRSYLQGLNRNVECVADVLILVAGSEKLLQLVREMGLEGIQDNKSIMTRLGWFYDGRGEWRWGIEIFEPDREMGNLEYEDDNDSLQMDSS